MAIRPGRIALDQKVTWTREELANLGRVTVRFSLVIPGRRRAAVTLDVPGERLRPTPDLDAFRAGITHEDQQVRRVFQQMLEPNSSAAHRWKGELPTEIRRGVAEILLDALERIPPRADPEPIFFWRTRFGTSGVTELLASLRRLRNDLVTEDLDRLLRLRNSCAVLGLRNWPPIPRLGEATRRALRSEDPLVVRNLELSQLHPGQAPTEEVLAAIERWLRSSDPTILRAGLHAISRSRFEPKGLEEALDRALASDDPQIVRAAVFTVGRRADGIDPRLFAAFRADTFRWPESESVRLAVLKAIEETMHHALEESDALALKKLVAPLLDRLDDLPSEQRGIVLRILRRDRRVADLPALLAAYQRNRWDELFGLLCDRGHDFGSPVLARIRETPILPGLLPERGQRLRLARLETSWRKLFATPPAPEAHYTALLDSAIRAGNDGLAAVACLPLASGQGPESLRALATAAASDDGTVAFCATWCLALRDAELARPWLDELAGDTRLSFRNGTGIRERHEDLLNSWERSWK